MSVGIPKMMKSSEPSKNSNALPGVNRKKIGIIIVCLSCLCLIPLYSTMYLKANNTVVGPLHKARNGTVGPSITSQFLVNNVMELGNTFLTNMVSPPSSLCSENEFPEQFVLETANRTQEGDSVVLEACAQNILTVTAVGKDGQNVTCEPWVDIYGRIVGPDLATYPKAKQYNLYFNKVEVSYIQGGNFEVRIPPLESGKYLLEILLVHKGASRELVYNTLKRVPCLDEPLVNTPTSILMVDTGKCATLPKNATALCLEGDVPGRWVTLPRTGCDGIHCEGNINVLASSNRVWAPYSCHYKLYNSQETKQCVSGKNILFIGDSITEELTNELMQIYYFRPNKPP
ncbi:uncharacterized protein [Ptychodera flava]|uniref:uncharacterized protein n=1 Tax=Ptychodera flava TaxID=63121 RepID=UPI00396A4210